LLANIKYSFLYFRRDSNRDNIDPDVLMEGVESYVKKESRLDELYDILGRCACKIHTGDLIVRHLKWRMEVAMKMMMMMVVVMVTKMMATRMEERNHHCFQ
jgi:hypothetical protein